MAFRINVFAILSLVFSIVFFPLGLAFGIIALRQIAKSGQKGKGLAIAGTILSGLILLFMFIGIFTDDTTPNNKNETTTTKSETEKNPTIAADEVIKVSSDKVEKAFLECLRQNPEDSTFGYHCYQATALKLNDPTICEGIEDCLGSMKLD